ncbi:hypothetical protein ABZ079_28225 [Streptomyces sp. NPDC006314]|uniref:hypothetical protein n=1 Tax=Streptomyces sp. NPDC006314 TaxID=3154475 RepID=UPI0033A4E555
MSEVGMVVPLGCLAAAAAGLLSPHFGAPLAVGLRLVGAGFFPAVVCHRCV